MKLLIILLIIFFAAIFIVFFESQRECKMLKITEYEVDTNGVFSKDKPVTIALLSDLHNSFKNESNKISDMVRANKPDIIILAGDMILSHSDQIEENKKTARLINGLCDIAPVYFGMGNHESASASRKKLIKLWESFYAALSKKVVLLRNDCSKIKINEKLVTVYGLELPEKYYGRFSKNKPETEEINKLIEKNDNSDYDILIAHNPDFFKQYKNWGAKLVLSGHNHGGMVRIPFLGGVISPKPAIFPKYDYGFYKEKNTIMIVSGGMGAHSIKIRINNVPELVIIKLI